MTIKGHPLMIVGAPRSGTSLMQKIIREHDGFISVAKESGFIWRQYTHPERNNWEFEGWQAGALDELEIRKIRSAFERYALSSGTWRRAAAFDVMRYQRSALLAPFLRAGYHAVALVNRPFRRSSKAPIQGRLVDKSVHSPMFLPLVGQVFPDALFIHIVRDGWKTVPSMLEGWLNPGRFFTYEVPGGHAIPDYPYRHWNFALTPGWKKLRGAPLVEVVCAQWVSLQQAACGYLDQLPEDRVLRVHLEDLAASPQETLKKCAEFCDLSWSPYFEKLAQGLPRVNARPETDISGMRAAVKDRMLRLSKPSTAVLSETNRRIGYPE